MAAPNKKIFIVGGTGAQGIPVVEALTKDGEYSVRILTRDPDSFRAQKLAKLANVELQQGQLDRDEDLRRGFKGCWGAWINIDGFVVGQKNELFWGIRGYQLAQETGIKFFVWANLDYSLRDANYDPQIHCGHYDTKGAVGSFVLSESKWHEQRQKEDPKRDASYMGAALFTTGPYLDMSLSAYTPMAPSVAADGVVEWAVPLGKDGAVPHIALEDCGKYVRWLFDHAFDEHGKPGRAAGMDLTVATDHVRYDDLAAAFTQVTGKPARFVDISEEQYFLSRPERLHKFGLEHSNISPEDDSLMTWEENFRGWWRCFRHSGGNKGIIRRDYALLDEILPDRIKNVREYFENHKDLCESVARGEQYVVLKISEDRGRLKP